MERFMQNAHNSYLWGGLSSEKGDQREFFIYLYSFNIWKNNVFRTYLCNGN